MGFLLILTSLAMGINEEFRAQNGIVTKEQQRSLDMSAELMRKHAERRRKAQEEYEKAKKEIMQGKRHII